MTQPFTAEPVEGGVRVEMTRSFVWGWGRALRRLALGYRRGNLFVALRRPFWAMTQASLLRQLYPDVAQSRRESADFLRRHRDALADHELVERVLAQWRGPKPVVLTHAEADEWIAVLGQLRLFFEVAPFGGMAVRWVSRFQETLVRAVDPGSFTGRPNEEAAALVAGFEQAAAHRASDMWATADALRLRVPQQVPTNGLPSLRHTNSTTDSSGEHSWQVFVHNDEINTFPVVHHVLRTACGQDEAQARRTTIEVHESGRSAILVDTEANAESMALRLTRLGVHASFGRVS